MLDYSYDYRLVAASLAIVMMAGFTGLSLLRGASALPVGRRKLVASMAAVALGVGIWSMHFVAMLGMRLPIEFYYDALVTLISALIAILISGAAILMLHFGERSRSRIVAAGAVVGIGIATMHYLGMSGMQLCRPVYNLFGVALAGAVSVGLGVAAFLLAYSKRGSRNILLGTAGFGLAVFTMHFVAMAGTGFVADAGGGDVGTPIGNQTLAFVVTLSAFLISGAFLLTGVSFAQPEKTPAPDAAPETPQRAEDPLDVATMAPAPGNVIPIRIPYEQNGRTHFVDHTNVAAVRAEGHYTVLYVGSEKHFCPWSITETESRLTDDKFTRTHRSYLVNSRFVTGFERRKDTGVCFFEGVESLPKAPVSRSRMPEVRLVLGL